MSQDSQNLEADFGDPNDALIDSGIRLYQQLEKRAKDPANQEALQKALKAAAEKFDLLPSPRGLAEGHFDAEHRDEKGRIPADFQNLKERYASEIRFIPDSERERFRAATEGIEEVKSIARGRVLYLEQGVYLTSDPQRSVEYGVSSKGELVRIDDDGYYMGVPMRITNFDDIEPISQRSQQDENISETHDISSLVSRLNAAVESAIRSEKSKAGQGKRM